MNKKKGGGGKEEDILIYQTSGKLELMTAVEEFALF